MLVMLTIPDLAMANDGWWVTNRTRAGYKAIFVGTQVKLAEREKPRLSLDSGAVIKIDEQWSLEPRYTLKLSGPWSYDPYEHVFRISLRLTLK